MRHLPRDDYDQQEYTRLNAEPWMLDALRMNPEYVSWGPHEDYMATDGGGWSAPHFAEAWAEFNWSLDDLNECGNFYFHIEREQINCTECDGSGHNAATKVLADTFYDHDGDGARQWCASITDDEVTALLEGKRLHQFKTTPTATEVNRKQRGGLIHDAINRWILIETRAKRLGVYGKCERCEGHGIIYTAPAAHLSLTLWMLHPRKGCSRGVEIKRVEQSDMGAVIAWLQAAAQRNADRFGKLAQPAVTA